MSNCGVIDALAGLAGAARDFIGQAILNSYQTQLDELFTDVSTAKQIRQLLDTPEKYALKGADVYQLAQLIEVGLVDGYGFCEALQKRLLLPDGLCFHLVDLGPTDQIDEETLDMFYLFPDEARMYWVVIDEKFPRDERGRFCGEIRPAIAAITP